MAKQTASPVEQHLEKGVLALCALLLLGVIAMYLVISPNKVQIEGERVAPGGIYEQIAAQAERLRTAVRNAAYKDQDIRVPSVSEISEAIRSPLAYAQVPPEIQSPLPPSPPVPKAGEGPAPLEVQLARFLAPRNVGVEHGRTVLDLVPPASGEDSAAVEDPEVYRTAVNWVTVYGLYHRFEQERVCREAGYRGRESQFLVGVDLQRRERRWDGTYTEWQDVKMWSDRLPPQPPSIPLTDMGGGKKGVEIETRESVRAFIEDVRDPLTQLDLMRPLLPTPIAGSFWKLPNYPALDVVQLDDEFLNAQTPGEYPFENRYQDLVEPLEPEAQYKKWVERVEEILKAHKDSLPPLREAEKRCEELTQITGLSTSQTAKITKLKDEVAAAIKECERRRSGPGSDSSSKPRPRTNPVQVVWAHDAMTGNVASGRTYQYHVRFRFLNRYAALPSELKDPEAAAQAVVLGEWSDPAGPVYIEPDAEFFIVGATDTKQQVRAEIFKWTDGFWVKESFNVEAGQPVTGQKKKKVTEGDEPEVLVDFDTGATIVDVDFDRSYHPVTATKEELSVKPPKSTVAVVYMDASGQLSERLLAVDKDCEARKEFQQKVSKPRPKRRETGGPPGGGAPPGGPPGGGRPGGGVPGGGRPGGGRPPRGGGGSPGP